ncbi:hypothetical protein ES708_19881 [subsurface metagenome]
MAKPELEYFDTEMIPWKPIEDSLGQYEKILSKDPETGSYTRLLLCQPDLEHCVQYYKHPSSRALCHENMWEEVFVVRGTVLDVTLNKTARAGYYTCRPLGMKHDPLLHPTGALCFGVRTKAKMSKPQLDYFDTKC